MTSKKAGSPLQQAPLLDTDRLRLRGHGLGDLEAMTAMWTDPAVVRFISGKPSTEQEIWTRLLRYAGHWALLGFGHWVVEEKCTGLFVGEVGFAEFKRDIVPSIRGIPELGWVLAAQAQGKGYATEALKAVLSWGDGNLGSPRTVCMIAPDNAASLRVADKCGYREYHRTVYAGSPTILLDRGAG
jgi:RimJ/RimL family protein N-acetyltransferase